MTAYTLLETLTVPRVSTAPNADRIVAAPGYVGVVDGSTPKPWDAPGLSGVDIADCVARTFAGLPTALAAAEAIAVLTDAVAALPGLCDVPPERRPCATFAVVAVATGEVWRVGEQWVLVNGASYPPRPTAENAIARCRGEILQGLLRDGADVEDLRRTDPGRAAILPALEGLVRLRNITTGGGYGALDGTPVPVEYVERLPVPAIVEVVLASDGYPLAAATLAEAERLLIDRVRIDPLMATAPYATKAVPPGGSSYDDRTYVRVNVTR